MPFLIAKLAFRQIHFQLDNYGPRIDGKQAFLLNRHRFFVRPRCGAEYRYTFHVIRSCRSARALLAAVRRRAASKSFSVDFRRSLKLKFIGIEFFSTVMSSGSRNDGYTHVAIIILCIQFAQINGRNISMESVPCTFNLNAIAHFRIFVRGQHTHTHALPN